MLIAIRSVEAPFGREARKVTGRKRAVERLFRRSRLIVTHLPAAVRRWSWTRRPAKVCAPVTRVDSRPAAVRRSETAGRTPTSVEPLLPPFQLARYDVRIRGLAT